MTTQTFNTADELRRIIGERRISGEALQTVTGISGDALASFLSAAPSGEPGLTRSPSALSDDESARLSGLAAQLTVGMEIDDDERLRAMLEGLTIQFRFTLENIALLAQADLEDLEVALRDPGSLSAEKRYRLAIRASYLIIAVGQARGR